MTFAVIAFSMEVVFVCTWVVLMLLVFYCSVKLDPDSASLVYFQDCECPNNPSGKTDRRVRAEQNKTIKTTEKLQQNWKKKTKKEREEWRRKREWNKHSQPACRHRADDGTDRLSVGIALRVQPPSGWCRHASWVLIYKKKMTKTLDSREYQLAVSLTSFRESKQRASVVRVLSTCFSFVEKENSRWHCCSSLSDDH